MPTADQVDMSQTKPVPRRKRRLANLLLIFVSALANVFANLASNSLPEGIKPYLPWSWLILGFIVIVQWLLTEIVDETQTTEVAPPGGNSTDTSSTLVSKPRNLLRVVSILLVATLTAAAVLSTQFRITPLHSIAFALLMIATVITVWWEMTSLFLSPAERKASDKPTTQEHMIMVKKSIINEAVSGAMKGLAYALGKGSPYNEKPPELPLAVRTQGHPPDDPFGLKTRSNTFHRDPFTQIDSRT